MTNNYEKIARLKPKEIKHAAQVGGLGALFGAAVGCAAAIGYYLSKKK